jgi:hypothetical protein
LDLNVYTWLLCIAPIDRVQRIEEIPAVPNEAVVVISEKVLIGTSTSADRTSLPKTLLI